MSEIPRPVRMALEDTTQDLDLLVFGLEQPPREDRDAERKRLRLELERLRDRLDDALRGIL
jgi:hypothetical protein